MLPDLEEIAQDATHWRRDFHAHPEVGYAVERTAGIVAEKLRAFGVDEVVEGIGRTGVVGVIRGNRPGKGRVIGLRADMDALPMQEQTNLAYASQHEGKMHACGHDGHTAMLLGAARYLAGTRDFAGAAVVIFQPAEEGGNGALAMVDAGMMDRFDIAEVYGLHNMPGLPAGSIGLRSGPIMGATDIFTIHVEGRGCHAAQPDSGIDSVLVAAHIVTALQSIVARNVDPLKSVVVSTTMFHGGDATNIIPARVMLRGTVRTLDPDVQRDVEQRLRHIARETARTFGATAEVDYENLCPSTINHLAQTGHARAAAVAGAGALAVDDAIAPVMAGEDFSFMLNARPGAFAFLGNGDSAGLHHPSYDFNDAILPVGIRYWAELVRSRCA